MSLYVSSNIIHIHGKYRLSNINFDICATSRVYGDGYALRSTVRIHSDTFNYIRIFLFLLHIKCGGFSQIGGCTRI